MKKKGKSNKRTRKQKMATRMKITKAAKMMSKITKTNNRPTRMQTINPARSSKNNRNVNKMW